MEWIKTVELVGQLEWRLVFFVGPTNTRQLCADKNISGTGPGRKVGR